MDISAIDFWVQIGSNTWRPFRIAKKGTPLGSPHGIESLETWCSDELGRAAWKIRKCPQFNDLTYVYTF